MPHHGARRLERFTLKLSAYMSVSGEDDTLRVVELKTADVSSGGAFFETGLKEQMLAKGVDTVFVTGFTTSGCVRASGVDSLSCNFRTVVVRDCVGDRDPPAHDANLYDLEAKYVDVVSLDQALKLLDGAAVAA